MRIALLCATQRGLRFLERLVSLSSNRELIVCSFREETWEPPFLDDIRELTVASNGQFVETRHVGKPTMSALWDAAPIDLMLVVGWRYLIPHRIYSRPRLGTFVFHDSLLPKYRGFSPTVWAMINGEDHTGVTLFEIAEGVDTGDVIDQERVSIHPDDMIGTVLENVTLTYLSLLERNLDYLLCGNIDKTPQDHTKATYTCRRLPEDNLINWHSSSNDIFNLIRAVSIPYPGAFTQLSGRRLRIWKAKRLADGQKYVGRVPGRIAGIVPGEGCVVMTGDGALMITEVQLDDSPIMPAAEVLGKLSLTLGR